MAKRPCASPSPTGWVTSMSSAMRHPREFSARYSVVSSRPRAEGAQMDGDVDRDDDFPPPVPRRLLRA